MFKKISILILSSAMLLSLCGCFALFVGAGAGAGTAVWLSGKLSQEFHASYDRVIVASEVALKSLDLQISKESKEADVTQLTSQYSDGKEIWIDIRKVSMDSTKVEVRVGAVNPDKEAAYDMVANVFLSPGDSESKG